MGIKNPDYKKSLHWMRLVDVAFDAMSARGDLLGSDVAIRILHFCTYFFPADIVLKEA